MRDDEACGLIISPEKSRIFSSHNLRAMPAFTIGGNIIPHCTHNTYLGAPVRITPAIPARQRIHPIVKNLLDCLQSRFASVKWLATNATGVSIPVVRTLYILFLPSAVGYLSPALSQLSRKALEPLDKFQNRVMRFIRGCTLSTRIANLQSELDLPLLLCQVSPLPPSCSTLLYCYQNISQPRRTQTPTSTRWSQPRQCTV